jgi:negative regulator of flagellin synthesis FlgM
MEITPKDSVNIEAYVNQVQDKDKVDATSEQPEKQQTKADTVVLSDTAKKVQEAQNQLEAIPDVREDKVAQLKEQIENGSAAERFSLTFKPCHIGKLRIDKQRRFRDDPESPFLF